MAMYTAVAFDFKLKRDVPQGVARLLDLYSNGNGPSMEVNLLFSGYSAYFAGWDIAEFSKVKDQWVCKHRASASKVNEPIVLEFMAALEPFIDYVPETVVVRTCGEEARTEVVYYYDAHGQPQKTTGWSYDPEGSDFDHPRCNVGFEPPANLVELKDQVAAVKQERNESRGGFGYGF